MHFVDNFEPSRKGNIKLMDAILRYFNPNFKKMSNQIPFVYLRILSVIAEFVFKE